MTGEQQPPTRDPSTVEEIDAELARLGEQVETLLDRISTLRARRHTVEQDGLDHLDDRDLIAAASRDVDAIARLRDRTRAMHPWLVDVVAYPVDVDGGTRWWAPSILLRRDRDPGEYRQVADGLRDWFTRFPQGPDPARTRVPHHRLVLLTGKHEPRTHGLMWVHCDLDEAYLLDGTSRLRRHEHEGTLVETLTAGAGLYYGD